MKKIMELINKIFGGRGIDKKFPVLLWLYKKVFAMTQKDTPIAVKTGYGDKLIVSAKDAGLGLMLRTHGEYEPILTKILQKNIQPSDIVMDVGANVGYFTKLMTKLVGRRGKVIAFEPSEINWKYLQKNVARKPNVRIEKIALSDKVGELHFSEDSANPGENGLRERGKTVVPTSTLTSWVNAHKIKKINLIKIDVEGAEVMVLQGAKDFLRKQKKLVVAIECNPGALSELGFTTNDLVKSLKVCGLKITEIIDERMKVTSTYAPQKLELMLSQSAYVTLIARSNDEK